MIALFTAALLAAATHDIATTPANTYSPEALRVAPGDTVRWQTSPLHPLLFEGEPAGPPEDDGSYERVMTASVRFYCANHGASGMTGVVTVGDANAAPAISIQRETASPAAGKPVAFRAVASDPERLALRIDWDMDGDGTFERANAGTQVSGTYDAGARTVRAMAIDDLGLTATASHAFTVPAADTGSGTPPPAGAPPPAAGTTPATDTLAPAVSVSAPRELSASRLRRRGVRVRLTPSEDGQLVVELRDRAGRRLARATAEAHAGVATALRVRPRRVRPGRLRLRIVAIDRAGNRTTVTRRLTALAGR